MRISHHTSDRSPWFDNLWAALIFFTRLPFWRIRQPSKEAYVSVVEYWPLVGWLTGGVMAGFFILSSICLPVSVSVIIAIVSRMLVTGALHEDGLADFLDGFGGGYDRDRILAIMKDSHIGTYGVSGLVMYELLLFALITNFASGHSLCQTALLMVAADSYGKLAAADIIRFLPYARTAETAKNHVVYRPINARSAIMMLIEGAIPVVAWVWLTGFQHWIVFVAVPVIVMFMLCLLMKRKIQGYTGDCCGAVCLLCELSCYLAANI